MRAEDNSRIAFATALAHIPRALKRRVLQRLRVIGAIEGVSFIVLMIAAIVFKRILGQKEAIFVTLSARAQVLLESSSFERSRPGKPNERLISIL